MKVVIDANIFFSNSLAATDLPQALRTFFAECGQKKHEIIVTLTTKLEFDRNQQTLHEKEIREVSNAKKLLKKYKIDVGHFDESIIPIPDLIDLIQRNGVKATLVNPTKEDFDVAHERACLHSPPHPPDIRSDEMRDLVVWSIALNLTKVEKPVLLISNDNLHHHPSGDNEASTSGLVRVRSIEAALDYMEIETPNGKAVRALLDVTTKALLKEVAEFKNSLTLSGVKNVVFRHNKNSDAIEFSMISKSYENKEFRANVRVDVSGDILTSMKLDKATFDSKPIEIKKLAIEEMVDRKKIGLFQNSQSDYQSKLEALKETLQS